MRKQNKILYKWILLCILICCSCTAVGCSDKSNEKKKDTQVENKSAIENLQSGIYDMDLKMLEDWDSMLSDGTVSVEAGILSSFSSEYDDCILVIDDSVTEIGEEAFSYNNKLKEIVIPDSVTEIDEYAFWNCRGIETVYGGSGVTRIGASAFAYCINLKRLSISEHVSIIKSGTFDSCKSLENIDIPNGVTIIEDDAFWECKSLENITIPDSMIEIGDGAFGYCTAIISLKLPNTLKNIGEDAFLSVNNIVYTGELKVENNWGAKTINGYVDEFAVYEDDTKKKLTGVSTMVTEWDIPDSVTEIGPGAFGECNKLVSITIPENVEVIGKYAFWHVNNIVYNGKLASKNNWGAKTVNGYVDGCAVYEDDTKKKLTGVSTIVTEFDIPNSVTEIGQNAFLECEELEEITIPDGVKRIGKWAFAGCQELKNITIPNSVKVIEEVAFSDCQKLVTVTLPNKLKKIETELFFDCEKLKNVDIPDSVTEIGEKAFVCCYNLEGLIVPDTVIRIGKDAFYGVPVSGIIYNGDAVDDYEDSNGRWGAE